MRRIYVLSLLSAGVLGLALVESSASHSTAARSYVVVYAAGASPAAARDAVEASGATIVRENLKVGVATVVSRNPRFLSTVRGQRALLGAALDRPVGHTLGTPIGADGELAEARAAARGTATASVEAAATASASASASGEPFADKLWGMEMIHATADGSHAVERGDGVLVGVIDTGIDGSHPDIAPNFSAALSRNFTTDIPLVDGPCEDEPDGSCNDPADVDENSHGTHVASIIGSPINELGVAGVAPDVTLVNLRAGQDSGFLFLQPSVDALTYAGDRSAATTRLTRPRPQMQQRTIIEATQRSLDYAHKRGVVLIAASGNGATDLGAPTKIDEQSPNFPPGNEYTRTVDNKCLDLPTEGNHVLSINALGPSKRKADYSNYGVEQSTVAAPGGFFRDDPLWKATDPPAVRNLAGIPNLILAAFPENVAREFGEIDPDGTPNTPFVLRDCNGAVCAYYQYLQGTSMASPHATGVAALIIGRLGDRAGGIHPRLTAKVLQKTATDHPCPEPRLHSYADKLRGPEFDAFCAGTPKFNGFYGHGIVDALRAVLKGAEAKDAGDDE